MLIETEFTPILSLAGGLLIGTAAVLLMGLMGRIMGATGVLTGVIVPQGWPDWSWRIAVILGMISGPVAIFALTGQMPVVQVPVSLPLLILGGFLVGIGVTYGAGCTSGHGVCGMARLSPRSIAATVTFMFATCVTVFIIRHGIGG